MPNLEPTFPFKSNTEVLQKHLKYVKNQIAAILPSRSSCPDNASFSAWMSDFFPFIKSSTPAVLPDCFSITLLCKASKHSRPENFFLEMIKKWLIPQKELEILSFNHLNFDLKEITDEQLLWVEVRVLIEEGIDLHRVRLNLPSLIKNIKLGISSPSTADVFLNSMGASREASLAIVHQNLVFLMKRFPSYIDQSLLQSVNLFLAFFERDFFEQRDPLHLTRIIVSQYFVRRKVLHSTSLFPQRRHLELRVIPTSLKFTFGSKSVIGIVVSVSLLDKYETFNETHIASGVKKFIDNSQLVKGSIFSFQKTTENVKVLYAEFEKIDGSSFSLENVKVLKNALGEELKLRVEQLVPKVFMIRNEEEVLRNILTLSREVKSVSDLPQVMISLDQQTTQDIIFTVILVRVVEKNSLNIEETLTKAGQNFSYVPERKQIVGYLRNKYPIEAHVFQLSIPKDPALLRLDLSLNFYRARQRISSLLESLIGEFRDFNGGIILKQHEGLDQFKNSFTDIDKETPDLLESFFYALSPIESQATLPKSCLKLFFNLFLEAQSYVLSSSSSCFFKSVEEGNRIFVMIRMVDMHFKEIVNQIVSSDEFAQKKLVSMLLNIQGSAFFGYILETRDASKRESFLKLLQEGVVKWREKIESLQILKLGLCFPVVSLDPRIGGGDETSLIIIKMLFEGLMKTDNEGRVSFGIAKFVEISPDYKVYIFKLRESYWSNGSVVTAYDFEYTWKKVLSPTFKTPFAYLLYPILNAKQAKQGERNLSDVGIKALDDFTLRVDLEYPAPYFLELTAHSLFYPVNHILDQTHPNWALGTSENFVCNGPFSLGKSTGQSFELDKNGLYWDSSNISIDQVLILRLNQFQAFEMLKKNEIHWIEPGFGASGTNFVPSDEDDFLDVPNNGIYWYVFNTTKYPFNNKKMRKAFSLAINRSDLLSCLGYQQGESHSPLPPSQSQVLKTNLEPFDLEHARFLFAEALEELGSSLETLPVLNLIHTKGGLRHKTSEFIKNAWEKAFGIQCKIETYEWDVLFAKVTQGEFYISGLNWKPWIRDPIYTLGAFKTAKELINFPKWENTLYQEVLTQAENEADPIKRKLYLKQAEEILIEEVPVIPLFQMFEKMIKKKNLDITLTLPVVNFRWASLRK